MATIDNTRIREAGMNSLPYAGPTRQEGCLELLSIPLFSKLPAEVLRQISAHGVVRTYPKHMILIHEKDSNSSLYVILRGRVKIYVSSENGKELVLNVHSSGEYFGELELIDSDPCATSVMTLEPSHICMISKAGFQCYLSEHPAIAFELLHALAQRVRQFTAHVKSLALDNVYGRVTHTLLHLATKRDGQFVIDERLIHQDLANRVGASREMVSRILKDLRAGGYLKVKDGKISIQSRLPLAW
jgi:CRP/FNR family cyclic AMP-dependent transcriptional regulator